MHTNIKTKNGKKLQLQALVDSGCTHTGINKQLVKKEKIKTEPMDRSFEVFNADETKMEKSYDLHHWKLKSIDTRNRLI